MAGRAGVKPHTALLAVIVRTVQMPTLIDRIGDVEAGVEPLELARPPGERAQPAAGGKIHCAMTRGGVVARAHVEKYVGAGRTKHVERAPQGIDSRSDRDLIEIRFTDRAEGTRSSVKPRAFLHRAETPVAHGRFSR